MSVWKKWKSIPEPWRVRIEMLAMVLLAIGLALWLAGCVAVPSAPDPATGETESMWVVGIPAWVGAFFGWLWSAITGRDPPTPDVFTRMWDSISGFVRENPVESIAIGNGALAAFPNKVQDGLVTAVNPKSGATPTERVLSLLAASPLGFFFHSPPVKKRQAARKAKKAKESP